MITSTDVVNQALQLIGNNAPAVTGVYPTFDQSPAGVAASRLYGPAVDTVARQVGWDCSRGIVTLTKTGNLPPTSWNYEYLYPTNGIQVWQIMPAIQPDPHDPLPYNFTVGNTLVTGNVTKVIWANLNNAVGIVANRPGESLWDPLFRETVVRLLGSELAMALAGRPDTSNQMLEQMAQFASIGSQRTE